MILTHEVTCARFKLVIYGRDGKTQTQNIESLPMLIKRIAAIAPARSKGYEVLMVMHIARFEDPQRDSSALRPRAPL